MESLRLNEHGQITISSSFLKEMDIQNGAELKLIKKDGYFLLLPSTHDSLTAMQDIMNFPKEM